MKKYIAELIGTFAIVFCGTGAIIIDQQTGGGIGHTGIAITFGLIVMVMIYVFGDISGAHFNPAVTISFSLTGLTDIKEVMPYTVSQFFGAFGATIILQWLFSDNHHLGASLPAGSLSQSFVLELLLTFLLMSVILFTSQGKKEVRALAGICIGATVLLESMFAGKICGASMNPARSLAPAIMSGNLTGWWIYVIAPISGAILAAISWRLMK